MKDRLAQLEALLEEQKTMAEHEMLVAKDEVQYFKVEKARLQDEIDIFLKEYD